MVGNKLRDVVESSGDFVSLEYTLFSIMVALLWSPSIHVGLAISDGSSCPSDKPLPRDSLRDICGHLFLLTSSLCFSRAH